MATYQTVGTSAIIDQAVTSTVVTKPTGVAVDDLLLAGIYCYGTSDLRTITPPPGWTLVSNGDATSTNLRVSVYSRIATSTDVSATNYTWTANSSAHMGGIIVRASSFGIFAGASNGNASAVSSSTTYSGFTPTRNNCLFVHFGGTGLQPCRG